MLLYKISSMGIFCVFCVLRIIKTFALETRNNTLTYSSNEKGSIFNVGITLKAKSPQNESFLSVYGIATM